jgi:organic radical activating enzyme
MWTEGNEEQLAQAVIDVLPHKQLINPISGRPTILSLTGGEPTLRAKHLLKLLNHPIFVDLQMVLIETNCSVPLSENFTQELYQWSAQAPGRKVIWSNSPKLSISGESWKTAIRPEIAYAQAKYQYVRDAHIEQYFKFVCGPNETDFDEVERAMQEYYHAGISYGVSVYIMPTACLEEQQQQIAAQVAKLCIERGYIYCHRIQNSVFGNGVGT